MTQAPMPSLPIERGRPGPGLLAHVLVSKYCDHLPLYRQAEIHARDGLDLPRGLLAGWVGKSAALIEPMAAFIGRHALAGPRVHADDTPMPMLAPGKGRTQTARFWACLRDDRPFGGRDPPAVLYECTPDRKGEHPQRRLRDFQGILQAEAHAGFNALYEGGRVVEAACWTHARRHFHDVLLANGSPLAREAIERMRPLFAIEAEIHGQLPEARLAARQARSAPIMADLHAWLGATLRRISGKSDLAKAIRSTLARWTALTTFCATAAPACTTTPPSGACARSRRDGRTICSPDRSRAAGGPRSSTPSSAPQSSMAGIRRPICACCPIASPTTRSTASANSRRGTCGPTLPEPRQAADAVAVSARLRGGCVPKQDHTSGSAAFSPVKEGGRWQETGVRAAPVPGPPAGHTSSFASSQMTPRSSSASAAMASPGSSRERTCARNSRIT